MDMEPMFQVLMLGDEKENNGKFTGVTPKSKLFFQSLLDNKGGLGGLPYNINKLFEEAYQNDVRIHNKSWGALAKDYYRINSMEVDEFVEKHHDMLIVISTANEGIASKALNSKKGYIDWFSLGWPATAKNALTVGASRSSRTDGGWSQHTSNEFWPDDYPDAPIANEKISGNLSVWRHLAVGGQAGI